MPRVSNLFLANNYVLHFVHAMQRTTYVLKEHYITFQLYYSQHYKAMTVLMTSWTHKRLFLERVHLEDDLA